MDIFGSTVTTLQKALDIRGANQRVIASNLANVDTPGYTAQRLNFDDSMQQALEAETAAPVIEASAAPRSLDGNNVDLEGELSELSRNKLMYNVTAQIMAAKFRQTAMAVSEQG